MRSYQKAFCLAGSLAIMFITTGCQTTPRQAAQPVTYLSLTESIHQWRLPQGRWQEIGGVRLKDGNDKAFEMESGQGVFLNEPSGHTVNLISHKEHGDVSLHVEFVVPKGSNSGVYLQARYEVQVLDSWGNIDVKHSDCGGIYQRWADNAGFEGHAPKMNASLPPGEWQSFDIIFRAPRFNEEGEKTENARFIKVVHNGVIIHENVEVSGPTRSSTYHDENALGPLMLQGDHGPVAYRNIVMRSLNLD
ncbi:MAG: DUF1080 domain-containing protein [Verrucomicrobia bacterium]|jgi:hypothetical protein|nr:DUF1080 domain-containing protein [Verrucomicrobiota bacterium]